MIGIRVDVNKTVATGHILRDLAVARKLRELGQDCLFFSADEECLPYLEKDGFSAVILHSDWKRLDGETEVFCAILREKQVHSLLVDSYYVTPSYVKRLSEITRVTYFDELFLQGYGCQQLINGLLEPPDYSGAPGTAFTGPAYVALREEFEQLPPKEIRPSIQKILVTSGGTDNHHFGLAFLERFLREGQWKSVRVTLVVGSLCSDREELLRRYGGDERVEILVNTSEMARLLQDADYAVTAGGTTLYEVCAAGVAASSYVLGDNQVELAKSFARKELIAFAGDFRTDGQKTMDNVLAQMAQAGTAEFRREKASRLQGIVDGQGARRIAEILL